MGCGCSMDNKRVAAAPKGQTTSAEEVGDVGPNTPATAIDEQRAAPERASPQNEKREFLQEMSPPPSPGGIARTGCPVVPASDDEPPVPVGSETVATEAGNAVLSAVELGKGNSAVPRADDGVVVGTQVAPSSGGRGGRELLEGDGGGRSARAPERSIEEILRPGELQERPRRFSKQDPLPQLAPLPAASADVSSTQLRGYTLGPGLDIGFREEPTSIVPTAAAGCLASGEGSGDGNTGIRPTPVDQGNSEGRVESARHTNNGAQGQGNSDEDLIVTAVTPHDVLDEDMMSDRGAPAKDRWPRGDDGSDDSPSSGRGGHYDRTAAAADGTPPRHEARPALAARSSEAIPQAPNTSSFGGREGLSSLDFTADGNNDLSPATGGMYSSGDDGPWGTNSGAYSLLDADEEDFMETLLMES